MVQGENSGLIGIGTILKTVGLGGLCSLEVFGDTLIRSGLPLSVHLGRTTTDVVDATVESLELRNKTVVCTFKGVNDRDAAEALRGLNIYIAQDRLPVLGSDEYYHFELEGMGVYYENGEQVGIVDAVHNYPSTDALDVRLKKDSSMATLPLIPDCVVRVDKKDRKIFVKKDFLDELL
ncbi:MAG TPA: ribosome maturation factor RimM [Chitinispirillaceae bacterium]|nr:ribosome maturation factor RimM [Chitinispirillaceae bacterium]